MTTDQTEHADVMNGTFKRFADNFSETFRVGMKFYEDSARLCTDMATRGLDEGRTHYEAMAEEMTRLNRTNLDRFQRFFEEQTRRNTNLTPYVCDPAGAANPAEVCDRLSAMWRTSFETLRDSVKAASKATAEVIQGWSQICRIEGKTDAEMAGSAEKAPK